LYRNSFLRKVLAHGFDSKSLRVGATCRVVLSHLTSAKSIWSLCVGKVFALLDELLLSPFYIVSSYIKSIYPKQILRCWISLWLIVLAHVPSSLEARSAHTMTFTGLDATRSAKPADVLSVIISKAQDSSSSLF
jgi:hypothetical protein